MSLNSLKMSSLLGEKEKNIMNAFRTNFDSMPTVNPNSVKN
jgi:hypothetical protein